MSAPATTTPVVDETVATTTASETVEATPVPAAVVEETPAAVTTEEATTKVVEEPTTTTEEAPAVPAKEATATVAPTPTPSKSTPSKRLSLLIGKAKNFVDKVAEKKPSTTSTKKEASAVVTEEPAAAAVVTEEPEAAAPAASTEEAAATTAEHSEATKEPEAKAPKFEKRKSILSGIFRSKVNIFFIYFSVGSQNYFFYTPLFSFSYSTTQCRAFADFNSLPWPFPKQGVLSARLVSPYCSSTLFSIDDRPSLSIFKTFFCDLPFKKTTSLYDRYSTFLIFYFRVPSVLLRKLKRLRRLFLLQVITF